LLAVAMFKKVLFQDQICARL